MKKVGAIAYKLELPQELSRVHNTFHVSNLKKCYSDVPLVVPLEGLQVDDKLHFVKEPIEIMDHEFKKLRQSRVPIVKYVAGFEEIRPTDNQYESIGITGGQESSPTESMMQDDSISDEQVNLSDDVDSRNNHSPKTDSRKD
ncbi:hypothetical protein Tco_0697937 [Tanacetum coccineum]